MSVYQPVGKVGQLADGQSGTVVVDGKTVAIFRVGEAYYAIDDMCPHMGASLSGGFVENGIVTCPWHFWRFRLEDGAWADNPRIKIGCYKVTVVGEDICLQLPPPTPPTAPPPPVTSATPTTLETSTISTKPGTQGTPETSTTATPTDDPQKSA